jgi:CubicO group peptidase (beta-lactamase class C family)
MKSRNFTIAVAAWLAALLLGSGGSASIAQTLRTTQSGAALLPDAMLMYNPGRPWWYASKPSPTPLALGTRAPSRDEEAVIAYAHGLLMSRPAKAIALLDGDNIVFVEYKDPAGPESAFFGASMGKTVTSMIAGKAICAGQLAMDARADKLLPELKGKALGTATVADLLRMASGAADPSSDSSIMTREQVDEWWAGRLKLVDLVAENSHSMAARGVFSDYKPGEQFSYKSTDPLTLGIMVHRASGKPMSSWFQSSVLDPMGAAFAGS